MLYINLVTSKNHRLRGNNWDAFIFFSRSNQSLNHEYWVLRYFRNCSSKALWCLAATWASSSTEISHSYYSEGFNLTNISLRSKWIPFLERIFPFQHSNIQMANWANPILTWNLPLKIQTFRNCASAIISNENNRKIHCECEMSNQAEWIGLAEGNIVGTVFGFECLPEHLDHFVIWKHFSCRLFFWFLIFDPIVRCLPSKEINVCVCLLRGQIRYRKKNGRKWTDK